MKLTLERLSKTFTTRRGTIGAVSDISLSIDDGEFFVLLGPSGCGKSTLLNCVAGLEVPTAGEIRFDETCVASAQQKRFLSPRERNVAMVFQNYALYPHLTVYENVAFPLRISGLARSKIDSDVRRVTAQLGISSLLGDKPAELSGGQRQRVAIARAIVRRPSVFLLDEPLSNLDAKLRTSTRAELKKIQRELGITTIYVTHDQTEAMTLGDRIAVLNNGRVEQVGAPGSLYNEPANPFVASFIGSPPMNLLSGKVTRIEGALAVECAGSRARFPEGVQCSEGPCILGVRPENVRLNRRCWFSLEAPVVSKELLGRESLVHVQVGERFLSVLCGADVSGIDGTVICGFEASDLHIFPHQ